MPLPEGFVLDENQKLPEGFVLDKPAEKTEPWYKKSLKSTFPTYLPGINMTVPMGTTVVPSAESAAEALPAVGSTVGAIALGPETFGTGSIPGAMFGGAAGEALRQFVRKYAFDEAPATGLGQELAGLDPSSKRAMVLGVLEEALGGGAFEKGGQFAAKTVAPWMKEKGLRWLAKSVLPNTASEEAIEQTVKSLEPIAGEIKAGTRGMLKKQASAEAEEAGKEVGRVYAPKRILGIQDVTDKLKDESAKTLLRKGVVTPQGSLPPVVLDKSLRESLTERLGDLTDIAKNEDVTGHLINMPEMHRIRAQAGKEATRLNKSIYRGGTDPSLEPKAAGWMAEQSAASDVLHRATGSIPSLGIKGEGELADEAFHAWSTIKDMGADRTNILARWLVTRALPGPLGVAAGGAVASPVIMGTTVNRAAQLLGNALESGDRAGAANIIRAFEAIASGPTHSGAP